MNNQPGHGDYDSRNQQKKNHKKNKNAERDTMDKAREAMQQLQNMNRGDIPSDTMGSYTGLSYDGENPEQDADDL